jgi:hypothetical protein
MWEPRRLTTLCDSTACYGDNFNFFFYTQDIRENNLIISLMQVSEAFSVAAHIPATAKGHAARNEQCNIVCFQATSSDSNGCHLRICAHTKFPQIMELEASAPLTLTSATETYHETGKSILHSTSSMEQGHSREPDSSVAGQGIPLLL